MEYTRDEIFALVQKNFPAMQITSIEPVSINTYVYSTEYVHKILQSYSGKEFSDISATTFFYGDLVLNFTPLKLVHNAYVSIYNSASIKSINTVGISNIYPSIGALENRSLSSQTFEFRNQLVSGIKNYSGALFKDCELSISMNGYLINSQ